MKTTKLIAALFAVAGLLTFTSPVNAQGRHGGNGGNGGNGNHGHGNGHGGNWHNGHWHGGGVNFYVGGFGYPFYFGYPYWGYPYYGYPSYGYGYPVNASYSYDPQGVYQGRLANGSRGANGSVAAQVQQQLAAGGYYHGEIDGIIGEATRRAIRKYEQDNNLPVDGQIDDQLLATMRQG
jgi:Putative peptidoglycan binding domain